MIYGKNTQMFPSYNAINCGKFAISRLVCSRVVLS